VLTQLEDEMKSQKYAGLVLEPVQGRGGDRAFPDKFLVEAALLAKKYGVKLIFDEVFTGFGRTGKMFAFEHSGVVPDILVLGKALGGGLPLSACAGDILDVWGKSKGESRHTSTFLGHPLACATGHASLKEIVKTLPELIANQQETEKLIKQDDFGSIPCAITGKGYMRGLWFHESQNGYAVKLAEQLLQEGFLVLPSGERGDVLSLTPPLIMKANAFRKLFDAIRKWAKRI